MTLNGPEAAVELDLSDRPLPTQSGRNHVVSCRAENDSKWAFINPVSVPVRLANHDQTRGFSRVPMWLLPHNFVRSQYAVSR
jgi:hypothetical protein